MWRHRGGEGGGATDVNIAFDTRTQEGQSERVYATPGGRMAYGVTGGGGGVEEKPREIGHMCCIDGSRTGSGRLIHGGARHEQTKGIQIHRDNYDI